MPDLRHLLRDRFGLEEFRPFQETVCRALVEGADALLVMPTGAGKSLCYQLPALARGGTGLVISPLIALMEDQVAQLQGRGLRAERIHSGRDRGESREVCRAYLAGDLDFLFVAPERLGVPGFVEFLARKTPALIAVDEAHCISQWGHDFRPDYRKLGARLAELRGAPLIAMTATATPLVQRDILQQLELPEAQAFIHGFRRDNIGIELVELNPGARTEAILGLLTDSSMRPAIVYAPTRKGADQMASDLSLSFPTAAYHAGMPASRRDAVQSGFLSGRFEVVVATIAFGMGIDKANVRTVVHAALPASVEGYYQEIGRAGRDGLPSRALLLHGWIDRRTHEFFLKRDYPDQADMQRVFVSLDETPREPAEVAARSGLPAETIDTALEKLWIHGGAVFDADQRVVRGKGGWERGYVLQREHKVGQLDLVSSFTQGHQCRMLQLVRHFGDREDSGERCGHCDVCAPDATLLLRREPAAGYEIVAMERILEGLGRQNDQATGRMFRELLEGQFKRDEFELFLTALARAGKITIHEDAFEKDGSLIRFQRARLTAGGAAAADCTNVALIRQPAIAGKKRTKKRGGKPEQPLPDAAPELVEALTRWRLHEARQREAPAFTILNNATLQRIAALRPDSEDKLLEIKGIGPALAKRHGSAILEIVAGGPSGSPDA
jgi:DNA topoisomerase-3